MASAIDFMQVLRRLSDGTATDSDIQQLQTHFANIETPTTTAAGATLEYVYATSPVPAEELPSDQLPNNAWGYLEGGTN